MTPEAGEYAGLDRFEARKRIVARLEAGGAARRRRSRTSYNLGYCQRCDTVIEPYLSTQWFVKIAATRRRPPSRPSRTGRCASRRSPGRRPTSRGCANIHDWCISRQLWWGHRIPAFTCENGHVTVSEEDPSACATCGSGKLDAGSRRARHVVLVAALALLGLRLAREDAGPRGLLSDRRARDRLRHPLLLGRPDDHGRPALHREGAVPHGPPPRPRARGRREDVEDQGQRHRSARGDRGVRRRRRPVHAGLGGLVRPDRLGRARPDGGLAQFRDEALERGALHARAARRPSAPRRI